MGRGIDITRTEASGKTSLEIGGVPFVNLRDHVETRFGLAPMVASPEDDALARKTPLKNGPEGWCRVPPGEGIELERQWSRLDVRLLKAEPESSLGEGGDGDPFQDVLLEIRSPKAGEYYSLVTSDEEFLRDLLHDVVRTAIEEGGEVGRVKPLPAEVLDRIWKESLQGIHLNHRRKILREDELVLTGNLGTDFHARRRPSPDREVRVFRIVRPRRGPTRWEGPEDLPVAVYIREHLDDWPGTRGAIIAAIVVAIAAALLLLSPSLIRFIRGV
ncbi:MAG: hypothetical protein O7H41_14860 [Planctomycetota bacterium]|nr:hypothetical protein [Planctomycetota bacterium]